MDDRAMLDVSAKRVDHPYYRGVQTWMECIPRVGETISLDANTELTVVKVKYGASEDQAGIYGTGRTPVILHVEDERVIEGLGSIAGSYAHDQ